MIINTVINNENKTLTISPGEYLVDTLRDNGYKSVKRGCDKSTCGACSVIVDGKIVLSCTFLSARIDGKKVETIEGLQEEAEILGRKIVDKGGDQCGYCNPALIVTAIALKREFGKNATRDEIIHYINGNLCRCSGYISQLEAILEYVGE
ncbi:MAG: (2Fe-2S)-binding protein [Lachnospirales bacterium]